MKELLARLRTFNEIPAMPACIERLLPLSRIPDSPVDRYRRAAELRNLPGKAIEFLDEARRATRTIRRPCCRARRC